MGVRFPLPLRNVEDLLHEHGIDVGHETVRLLVEPVWHIVYGGDPQKQGQPDAKLFRTGSAIWMTCQRIG